MENKYSILGKRIINKLKRVFHIGNKVEIDPNYHFHELNESATHYSTKNILNKAAMKPDIILVLFAKNLVNSKNLHELQKLTGAKIFWLMYDMAPFTGGCHYAWECLGYQKACGNCPGLNSTNPYDISNKNLIFKNKQFIKTHIEVIAASEWLYRQSKSSSLFKDKPIHKIFLPIDSEIFKPSEKKMARKKLKIETSKKTIFFGAVYLNHLRKGPKYLIESLAILKKMVEGTTLDSQILLLVAGRGIEELADKLPFEYIDLGVLDNTYGIASVYQAADIFLCTSVEDSGPSMINQSIMAGTPVVSFEMGVALDMVINGETGYSAVLKDSEDLAKGLFNILSLSEPEALQYSQNCRKLGLKYSSPEVQTTQLENIFTKALHSR